MPAEFWADWILISTGSIAGEPTAYHFEKSKDITEKHNTKTTRRSKVKGRNGRYWVDRGRNVNSSTLVDEMRLPAELEAAELEEA